MRELQPFGSRVVVKPKAAEEVTPSGLIVPDVAQKKPEEGTVIAVGPGEWVTTATGPVRCPITVEVGDQVLFDKYAGFEFTVDGEAVRVIPERDILARLTGGAA